MPHKPVVRESATSTKVRMVFDASVKPHPLANSVNVCMHTSQPLQLVLWDIMLRARMSTDILLAYLQKAFLQITIKDEDRDAFRFLFNINGEEEQLCFARVPFGAEASPFMLRLPFSIISISNHQRYKTLPKHYKKTLMWTIS